MLLTDYITINVYFNKLFALTVSIEQTGSNRFQKTVIYIRPQARVGAQIDSILPICISVTILFRKKAFRYVL